MQGWSGSLLCKAINYHVGGVPCRPGPRFLEAWMETRESPRPELLPGFRELAWACCQSHRKSEMFGVSSVSASYVLVTNQAGSRLGFYLAGEWTLRWPLLSYRSKSVEQGSVSMDGNHLTGRLRARSWAPSAAGGRGRPDGRVRGAG